MSSGELGRAAVLVDHARRRPRASAPVGRDRDAAAAARDDHRAALEQSGRRARLAEHLARARAGHDAAPAAARVGRRRPSRARPRGGAPRRRRRTGRPAWSGRANASSSGSTSTRVSSTAIGTVGVDARRTRSRAGSRSGPASSRSGRRAAAAAPRPRRARCCSSSAPTCGPLPCVSTSSWPLGAQRERPPRRLAGVRAAAPPRCPPRPARISALPPMAMTIRMARSGGAAPPARWPAPAGRRDCATSAGAACGSGSSRPRASS